MSEADEGARQPSKVTGFESPTENSPSKRTGSLPIAEAPEQKAGLAKPGTYSGSFEGKRSTSRTTSRSKPKPLTDNMDLLHETCLARRETPLTKRSPSELAVQRLSGVRREPIPRL